MQILGKRLRIHKEAEVVRRLGLGRATNLDPNPCTVTIAFIIVILNGCIGLSGLNKYSIIGPDFVSSSYSYMLVGRLCIINYCGARI